MNLKHNIQMIREKLFWNDWIKKNNSMVLSFKLPPLETFISKCAVPKVDFCLRDLTL